MQWISFYGAWRSHGRSDVILPHQHQNPRTFSLRETFCQIGSVGKFQTTTANSFAILRDEIPYLSLELAIYGDVAQLVEHRLCKAGVGGSSPPVSTQQTSVR